MNIAGVLVHANPKQVNEVKEQLVKIPGVEVHAATDDGRLIVTIEEDEEKMMADTIINLHHYEGVLSAVLIYQYSHDENLEEEISGTYIK